MRQWFRNLKISQKLMLISVFFVMPDSVMFCFFITGINSNIEFARQEQRGNEYQRPLEDLLELIPQHRQLVQNGLNGKKLAKEELTKKEDEIDQAFDRLEEVNGRIGDDLQFTDEGLAKRKREHYRVEIVRKEWQDFKAAKAGMQPAALGQGYGHLIADVRMMITHAGDLSNLILDPDLDSYYTMDATLLALPETQDRLAAVTCYGEAALQQSAGLTIKDRQQLTVYATLLKQSDLDRITGSLQTALNEDPNFYGVCPSFQSRLPGVLQEYSEATQSFIALSNQVAGAEAPRTGSDEYLRSGTAARDASFKLWRVADEELDVLLQARIDAFRHKRTLSLCVAGCALLAAISFVTFITRSITGPLRQQAAELQGANSALEAEVAERKRAEVDLRHSETQLAEAQKIACIGSWELEPSAQRLTWSKETYRIHGFEPGEVETKPEFVVAFSHPGDRAISSANLEKALKEKKPFSFEHRIIRHDGQERILHQRGDVVLATDGSVQKVLGTAQDITERKQAEELLEKAHNDLVEISRQAGMAEVATGVLHNVGNVLNSVNVSAALISDRLGKSRVEHLSNVSALLNDHAHDLGGFFTTNPRGKKLPAFIQSLSQRLAVEQSEIIQEVEGLAKNIAHIKEIVAVQQSFAKVSGMLETLPATGIVEDALSMNDAAFERHSVTVVREFKDVPEVCVDKHKVLQILINLIRNAKYAVSEAPRLDKVVTVRIGMNGSGKVKIAVADNGIGIATENLTRIFSHGFTTKKEGHGFGLHSAALAANELGGTLTAHSDGPGLGALFTLELPTAPAES